MRASGARANGRRMPDGCGGSASDCDVALKSAAYQQQPSSSARATALHLLALAHTMAATAAQPSLCADNGAPPVPCPEAVVEAAQRKLDAQAKPPGSLGDLERMAVKLAGLQGSLDPQLRGAALLLFAADHGITRSNPAVSAYPREVTPAMFGAIARGQAASSVLCRTHGAHLFLVDVGVDAEAAALQRIEPAPGVSVLHSKVARGSAAFTAAQPALRPQECEAAMAAGAAAVAAACVHMAEAAAAAGGGAASSHAWRDCQGVICMGELGIGNTTAAAALLAALTAAPASDVCGRGTGVDDAGLRAKQEVVAAAVAAHAQLIAQGPLQSLQAVGGLELAAMVGAYLEASQRSMPVVVDGFVSGAAALAALMHAPQLRRCLFLSHASAEAGAALLLERLAALGAGRPALHMQLRLGEGTGALLALPLLRSAAAVMTQMASLQDVMPAGGGVNV